MDATGNRFGGSWLLTGDLNAILSLEEKRGGRNFGSSSHNDFVDFVQDFGLVDLEYNGNPFTWCNKRNGRNRIKERLDRGLSNHDWILLFLEASVKHLPVAASEHNPILIATNSIEAAPKPFKFESFWTRDPSSHLVIAFAWNFLLKAHMLSLLVRSLRPQRLLLKDGTWNILAISTSRPRPFWQSLTLSKALLPLLS